MHHEYTVGLPPTFGALFYLRGGRVEHEENHAHHPIVVTARFYWGWSTEQRVVRDAELPRLFAHLTGAEGLLAASNRRDIPAAWRAGGDGFGEAPLTVAVVFDDLLAGVAALRAHATAHAASLELRLAEAASEDDPLIHLRPSAPAVPRFDVFVTHLGADRAAVAGALRDATGRDEHSVRDCLDRPAPIRVAHALIEVRARTLAGALSRAGATVDLRRNDG